PLEKIGFHGLKGATAPLRSGICEASGRAKPDFTFGESALVSGPGAMTVMTKDPPDPAGLLELAENSSAWPFDEARRLKARFQRQPKEEVIFETGYGPSGLPHIGTFGEVSRTTMVRHAFCVMTDDKVKTRLIAFSDDMDGLRKVPDN